MTLALALQNLSAKGMVFLDREHLPRQKHKKIIVNISHPCHWEGVTGIPRDPHATDPRKHAVRFYDKAPDRVNEARDFSIAQGKTIRVPYFFFQLHLPIEVKLVYAILCYSGLHHHPTVRELEAATGFSRPTILRSLAILEEAQMIYTEERASKRFDDPVRLYYHLTDVGLWSFPVARAKFPGAEHSLIVRLDAMGAFVRDEMSLDRAIDLSIFNTERDLLPFSEAAGDDANAAPRHGQREITHGQREITHGQREITHGQREITHGQDHDIDESRSTPSLSETSGGEADANNTSLNSTKINNTSLMGLGKEEAQAYPITPRIVSIAKGADGIWEPSSFRYDVRLWTEAVAEVSAKMTLEGGYDFVEWAKEVYRLSGRSRGLPYSMYRVRELTRSFLSQKTPEEYLQSTDLCRPRALALVPSESVPSTKPGECPRIPHERPQASGDLGGFDAIWARMDNAEAQVSASELASLVAEVTHPDIQNDLSKEVTEGSDKSTPDEELPITKEPQLTADLTVDGLGEVQRSELTRAISFMSPLSGERMAAITAMGEHLKKSTEEIWEKAEPLYGKERLIRFILERRQKRGHS